MSCSCVELEAKYGQGKCKCAHYREIFPDCACERESVSKHSPGSVDNSETLVRTIFREQDVGSDGLVKPAHFRPEPSTRGFSVDRVHLAGVEGLRSSKRADPRFDGYLSFVAARCGDIRYLLADEGRRLFCIYDTAIEENRAHADICQNVVLQSGDENRKSRMMDIAWQLRDAFGAPQQEPPST